MEVSKEIIEVLDYIGDKFGIAVNWTDKNVLPYVQQLCEKFIKWDIATSVYWIGFAIIFVIAGIVLVKYGKKFINKAEDMDDMHFGLGVTYIVLAVCLFVISFIIIPCQIYDIVKDCYMPELRLYEYAKSFISNNTR
jgi:hypothetical protein